MAEPTNPTNLLSSRPDLAKEWHPIRNGTIGPNDVSPDSRKKVWWLCNKGHWYLASVRSRVKGKKCSVCSSLMGQTDLRVEAIRPDLLKDWHPVRNLEVKFSDVRCNHQGKVWWICSMGHEWEASIPTRLSGQGCPACTKFVLSTLVETLPGEKFKCTNPTIPVSDHVAKYLGSYESVSILHSGPELRRSKRFKVSEVVLVEKPMQDILGYAELHDFSSEGMMLRSSFPLQRGETVLVRLNKPLFRNSQNIVPSRVVWCRNYFEEDDVPAGFGIGVTLA
jgi:hypothetical protein